MYVLDEPSIGLHQRDNERLLNTLKQLRDIGNTVIVVEHDEEAIRSADHVVDIGPGAGVHGGLIVAEGTPAAIVGNPASLTGDYLAGRRRIGLRDKRRQPDRKRLLQIVGARGNNLKDVTVDIPVGLFTCITGVSGSGKSTLINDTLYAAAARYLYGSTSEPAEHERIVGLDHFDKVINVDQSPIGRTPRSNPATYTGLLTPIRELFAGVPEARARGYGPGRFSFNVKGGRCEACQGDGVIKVEMHFLPDIYVPCDVCHGKRYNRETLEVQYKSRNIHEILQMTVEVAREFFDAVPVVARKLQTLVDVGLSYITLGQSATTLSGGEAQRVKLALELSKRDTGRTLYILDEPTTGLHFQDIEMLLTVLHRWLTTAIPWWSSSTISMSSRQPTGWSILARKAGRAAAMFWPPAHRSRLPPCRQATLAASWVRCSYATVRLALPTRRWQLLSSPAIEAARPVQANCRRSPAHHD
jgi:excinuclease ABC subunit A